MRLLHDRMRQVLAGLAVADPEGQAVNYDRDRTTTGKGGHSSHRGSSAPAAISQRAVEFADTFRRLIELAELDLLQLRGQVKPPPRRDGSAGRVAGNLARDRKRRIAGQELYVGRPPEWVAFAEGVSSDFVRKARSAGGRDPATGLRMSDRPIETAANVRGESVFRPAGRVTRLTSRDLPEAEEAS